MRFYPPPPDPYLKGGFGSNVTNLILFLFAAQTDSNYYIR